MDQEPEEKSWREIVRENNEPGSPNILITLEDAAKFVNENPDKYDKAIVFLYKNNPSASCEDVINSSWFNAGMRFSEIIFFLEYMKAYFIQKMRGPTSSGE